VHNPNPPLRRDIVAIGASAGGVGALTHFLALMPRNLPASVLVVLHRSPDQVSHLRDILRRSSPLRVVHPVENEVLEHGVCYVPEPEAHLVIAPGGRIRLLHDGFYRSHNIDALFCSLAVNAGPRTIGIVLSGLLKDGAFGLRAIKDAGGSTLVQDPERAEFSDMPASAILYDGSIDMVASLDVLAAKVCELTGANAAHAHEAC
jgi:chemotaxis response regulator CheB